MSPTQLVSELRSVRSTEPDMTKIVHMGSGEANVKCSNNEPVESLTLLDTVTKNSNCESLGQNAIKFDCQGRDSELLGLSMSPNYMPLDSNQEQKRPELEDCIENANIEQTEFPSAIEASSSAVEYSAEPLQELSAEFVSADSDIEKKIPSLEDRGLNPEVEDNAGTSYTADSNFDQKDLPLNNQEANSNLEVFLPSENKDTPSSVEYSAEPPGDVIESVGQELIKETTHENTVENPSQPLEQRSENNENIGEMMVVESVCKEEAHPPTDVSVNSSLEKKEPALEDLTDNSSFKNMELLHDKEEAVSIIDHSTEATGDASENLAQNLRNMHGDSNENHIQLECGDKRSTGQSRKRKSLRSPISSTRVLRSRTQEKPKSPEPANASADDIGNGEKKTRRRRVKRRKKIAVDEFSGIKTHMKYLFHRIKYEQNFIDAYSGEGWKGLSLEKIKPEKELQRAKSRIFQYKLKIRALFQRIDTSLSQGRLPETLFDSDGEIDSEDIFCAKCGSKDLPANNDIILCDGACERGFHQFCLQPPLLNKDIPPDDEGWLCPGCDCKVDCIDMLNDFEGTDLSVTDSWETVFSEEAAAAASGKPLDDISGLPSDDSEDDDFNPDNPEVEDNGSQDESSSDESDSSDESSDESSDLKTNPNDELLMGLPSEDSEDDDFDPDAPEREEKETQDSSSSDFTSDSEDFSVLSENNTSPKQKQCEKIKLGGAKRHSLKDEVSYLLQSNFALASEKRHVERLDYKKLHDETYGVASSDSSDEDFEDNSTPKTRKRGNKAALNSSDQTPVDAMKKNSNLNEIEHSNRRSYKKLKSEGSVASESGSSRKGNRSKYGEDVIKRLYESFNKEKYPKRDVKESLARELGLTHQQVDKWFCNTRWSFFHPSPSSKVAVTSENPPKSEVSTPQPKKPTPDVEAIRVTVESKTRTDADHHASNQSSSRRNSKKQNSQNSRRRNR